ncbi:MAG: Rieske 2Fe-2S domain-containing protein [Phycisphaeraceae bacterium]|nr:Rieske 2Fe-2S domain-containing protein [Phycisphaeraceae bacterium]
MAQTYEAVTKVWIAPGCIVCDACETECPEVFDVQEETCVIRPPAKDADFTKPLTPAIKAAAEGCPVDVIKFEMVQVEGAAPWEGKEAATAEAGVKSGGGAASGAATKKQTVIPEGPPDPKWAGLLAKSHVSGSRSGGGPRVSMLRAAKAPPQAVAEALPPGAPPDARDAAMVGSGFARPRPGVVDRIRSRAGGIASGMTLSRRQFSIAAALAWAAMAATAATALAAVQAFFVPKVTKEPPSVMRVGKLSDFPEPGVYEQYKPVGIWIVYLPNGELVALSTICTHLGCIPNWLPGDKIFKCPCHGSGYYQDGVNFEGPAPRPLERYKVTLDGDWVVVDKSVKFRQELKQWDLPGAFLTV